MPNLDGKVALITGAGGMRGVGRATGMKLAGQGDRLVGCDIGHRPAGVKPADSRRGRLGRCGETGLEDGQKEQK